MQILTNYFVKSPYFSAYVYLPEEPPKNAKFAKKTHFLLQKLADIGKN